MNLEVLITQIEAVLQERLTAEAYTLYLSRWLELKKLAALEDIASSLRSISGSLEAQPPARWDDGIQELKHIRSAIRDSF